MNNKQRTTNFESQATGHERRGFTLVELVVAIGVMAMVVVFAGTVFKASIAAYRVATAQAEIMQKFRAITDQLNNDFRGLRKDAPLFIWFQLDPNDLNKRLDQIMFFADGDFQSTKIYGGNPIVGNVARIYYGQARVYSPSMSGYIYPWDQWANDVNAAVNYDRIRTKCERTLARRQHILTADTTLSDQWPNCVTCTFGQSDPIITYMLKNDTYEYDCISLSQWQAITNDLTNGTANVNQIISTCFDSVNRAHIKLDDPNTLHNLMSEGVVSFSVQWSYYYTDATTGLTYVYWWPSIDPDGNGNITDSDFASMVSNNVLSASAFGVCFNVAVPSVPSWFTPIKAAGPYFTGTSDFYPQAFKFTFTLYDSQGVFKDGQTFTHIVYLGD